MEGNSGFGEGNSAKKIQKREILLCQSGRTGRTIDISVPFININIPTIFPVFLTKYILHSLSLRIILLVLCQR